jgi:sulfur-oxidizing protein SoxZ
MARALINVPPKVKRGEIVEIKALISHPMETGYRPKGDGTFFPRDIIQKFVCTLNGEEIFRADFYPATAANPFIAFSTVAREGGLLVFSWIDDKGEAQQESAKLVVE